MSHYLTVLLACLCCVSLPNVGHAADTSWQYRLLQQVNQHQAGLWQRQTPNSRIHNLNLQYQQQSDNQQLQLAASSWLTEQAGADDADYEVSEAWWAIDVADWNLSVGKRKRDFDVNQALRPLDMFSPTDPLALFTLVAPGVWQAAADWFGSDNALTLLCNESQQPFLRYGKRLDASWGCGGRYYQQQGSAEWQAVVHHDAAMGWRIGGSWQQVLSDALALQSSWLWQQHSWQTAWIDWPAVIATTQPAATTSAMPGNTPIKLDRPLVQVVGDRAAWQFSAGLNYSTTRYNLLLEYGLDGQAPADQAWRALQHRLAQGKLQPIELRTSQQLFGSARISRQQWLLHLRSHDNTHWQHAVTLLYQPAVRGLLMSASLSYSTGQHSSFNIGIKHFTGATDNAFALLGLRSEAVAGVSYVF